MNSQHLHQRFCVENPITNLLVYETAENTIIESVKDIPSEEKLISGERICPLVDKTIEENSSPGFNLNLIDPEARNKLIKQLEEKAEAERENYRLKLGKIQLKKMAVKDKLTNLYNRHYLEPRLSDEISHSYRNSTPVSILFIDADNFKYVNDGEGMSHEIGDSALVMLGTIIESESRLSDILGRWGGEEFMIILPDTDEKGAMEAGEKLRVKIEKKLKKYLTTFYPDKAEYIEKIAGTISTGTSTYLGDITGLTNSKKLIEKADTAMYYSKLTGRNKCTAYKPGMENEVNLLKQSAK